MAKWTVKTIRDTIANLSDDGNIVLPVIQRELVWNKDKIIALFQTICSLDSFGGIMTVTDRCNDGRNPLFEYRKFNCHHVSGTAIYSQKNPFLGKDIKYIIDGQQRISAFYIGLKGSYDNEFLYFDLLSNCDINEFSFSFAKNQESLPASVFDFSGDNKRNAFWIKTQELFQKINDIPDATKIWKQVCACNEYLTSDEKENMRDNIVRFCGVICSNDCMGFCDVEIDNSLSITANRLRIVRLFQKLNQGGTILSGHELMRSVLKAYDAEHEKFLTEIKTKYSELGLDQDSIIKLIFLLQDQVAKDIDDISEVDSDFIKSNKTRLYASLDAVGHFLKRIGIDTYFSTVHPSVIPLTLIAYHFFHKKTLSPDDLLEYSASDHQNKDFHAMRQWLLLSLLNHVFQRGCGWRPDITGRKKIFEILATHKNEVFPKNEIFQLYRQHLHAFDEELVNDEPHLNGYERSLVYYIMYDKDVTFRQNDIDHIHPKNILEKLDITLDAINSISNFQWLFYRDNRSKQDKEFGDWILDDSELSEEERSIFLKKHFIPDERTLWYSDQFTAFLEARRHLIFDKINTEIV